MFLSTPLLLGLVLATGTPLNAGVIEGVVVHAVDQSAVPGAEVKLRTKAGNQWLLTAEAVADRQGKFRFERLAVDGECLYQAGASRDGVYYPGQSVRLSGSQPRAQVKLRVHDAVAYPSPLVVREHTITLSPKPDVLEVTESMRIDNPSPACYVGRACKSGGEPVTLQLSVPSDFARITFASEFFGRRFSLVGGKLVTGVPWPPGQRELSFSYVLSAGEKHYVWQRPLDLPSSHVKVVVRTDHAEPVKANLPHAPFQQDGGIAFQDNERTLAGGHTLRVEFGDFPLSVMSWARWTSLGILASLIVATVAIIAKRPKGRRDCASP